jgi:hypothetical protein
MLTPLEYIIHIQYVFINRQIQIKGFLRRQVFDCVLAFIVSAESKHRNRLIEVYDSSRTRE